MNIEMAQKTKLLGKHKIISRISIIGEFKGSFLLHAKKIITFLKIFVFYVMILLN